MILLDTHVLVRWVDPQAKPLPKPLIDLIETASARAVSAISCWEIAWLVRRGRLQLRLDLKEWMDEALNGSGVSCIAVDRSIAECAAGLFEHHRDPADRLIIATTVVHGLHLISLDGHFSAYEELSGRLIQADGSITSSSQDRNSDESRLPR